jgi:hypothetical protein
MLITEPPPAFQFWNAEPASEKRAVKIELDRPPKFI